MIWDDPWIAVATNRSGGGRFNTTLPPPPPVMPPGVTFRCLPVAGRGAVPWADWIDIVGTRWTADELVVRLEGAWIALLEEKGVLCGTCVLWPRANSVWILETLRARHGYGTLLMRAVMTWIWGRHGNPFVLAYTWELSLPALLWAWWRGWLASAAAIEYGWVWTEAGCSFCPDREWRPVGRRWIRPMVSQFADGSLAVVNDSGMVDGWGHVAAWRGQPDWAVVAARGPWKRLWVRGPVAPGPGWQWTGEFVVVGRLNDGQPKTEWVTAEI